ncbi:MAG: cation:proton antiporter [Sphingomonadales bacterium]
MIESPSQYAVLLAIVGIVIIAGVLCRSKMRRLNITPIAGYILIGVALAGIDAGFNFIGPDLQRNIDFLAKLGVVVLLFKVGLESDLGLLMRQLGNAFVIWLPNMLVAALMVFVLINNWPGLGLVPALFAGVAASATSIGVSTAVWEDAGALQSDDGALLLDVAELDDISAVILMSLLFAVAPMLEQGQDNGALMSVVLQTAAWQLLKLAVFSALCYAFSRHLEQRLTALFHRLEPQFGPLMLATAVALLIAAAADMLGFSLAIGALFAGLAFSRDPEEAKIERAFGDFYTLFSPFFFVAIGLAVQFAAIGDAAVLAVAFLVVAVLGKLLGAGLPAAWLRGRRGGLLIGFSMTPRAEIFLIVMVYGLGLGAWAVPDALYTAAVIVSLTTCLLAPVMVQSLLGKTATKETG